jgi:hypothetical protein
VTAVTAAIRKAPGTPSEQFLPVLRAAVTTEFTHVQALEAIGARPLTSRFWIPDAVFDGGVGLFTSFSVVEAIEVSLYLVGINAFTARSMSSARGCARKPSGPRPSIGCWPGSPPLSSARRRRRRTTWVSRRSRTRPPAKSVGRSWGWGSATASRARLRAPSTTIPVTLSQMASGCRWTARIRREARRPGGARATALRTGLGRHDRKRAHAAGVRTTTGITRSVFCWYSANCGTRSACAPNRRSRSSPVTSRAVTATVSRPISIVV